MKSRFAPLMFAALCATAGAAHGQAPDTLLATRVLALDAELHALEHAAQSAPAELGVFIGAAAPDLRLRKLSLRIDDFEAFTYEYADAEWDAIQAGGLHPAQLLQLDAGAHRLRVELSARTLDAGPTDPRAVGRIDQTITLAPGQTLIELTFTEAGARRSTLQLRTASGAELWPRAARFWTDADRPYAAARLLTRWQARHDAAFAGEAPMLLAQSLARFGGQASAPAATTDVAPVADFNAAIAATRGGDLTPLESLGSINARGEAQWSLRDRANLVLGYAHLQRGDGDPALEAFGRVRSPGPNGNAALLGFGWAFLVEAPSPGVGMRPASPALAIERPAFSTLIERQEINAAPDKDRRKRLERALVPWTELIGRDPLDLDAQEGALALAWALDQLGTGTQAHVYYQRAAEQLESARTRLDQAMAHVADGRAADAVALGQTDERSGWRAWLSDLPYADDTAYMRYLLADDRFVAALDHYRAARLLRDEIDGCARRLQDLPAAASLAAAVAATADRARATEHVARVAFDRAALDGLRARKQRTDRYLVEARFAMARHFDSAPPPEVELKRASTGTGARS
jgi:hypothetical protein